MNPEIPRREFIKKTSGAVAGSSLAGVLAGCRTPSKQTTAAASTAASVIVASKAYAVGKDTIKIGLVGCGGRGSGNVREALLGYKDAVLISMGDIFEDELDRHLVALKGNTEINDRILVTKENCFVGFDAYKKVVDSGVDVVILATPPGFRSIHAKYVIEKNKHLFCEKPICTDAFGYRSFMATVAEAKRKGLGIGSGFCWRSNLAQRAVYQKVLAGEIGDIRTIYGTYNTGPARFKDVDPKWNPMEAQLRNWMHFTWLSGDHIVEQAIHNIDLTNWAMNNQMPVKCTAHGGRQIRPEQLVGHIFDHFSVVYEWENGAKGFLFCRQQLGCHSDNTEHIYGTKGTAHILLFNGVPYIQDATGKKVWKYDGDPKNPNMYVVEQQEFLTSIKEGKPRMDGEWLANSSMMGVMGRMAGYTGQEITWEDAINSKEQLVPNEADIRWDKAPAVPPLAIPGQTKFI
ncbi:MAG: putative dehydrogenase [Verrucomicrobiales bacterium]|nr:putative dehydrogenase [Verrucomicrobiales bacterium]